MKHFLSIVQVIWIALTLSACSDDDGPQDPFVGSWEYQSTGSGPEVDASFDILLRDGVMSNSYYYDLTNFELTINGVTDDDPEFWFRKETIGESVEQLWLIADSDSIAFVNLRPDGSMDSAVYMPGIIVYHNQTLVRK